MNRRDFLKGLAALPAVAVGLRTGPEQAVAPEYDVPAGRVEWADLRPMGQEWTVTAVASAPMTATEAVRLRMFKGVDYFSASPGLRLGDRITFAKRRRRA